MQSACQVRPSWIPPGWRKCLYTEKVHISSALTLPLSSSCLYLTHLETTRDTLPPALSNEESCYFRNCGNRSFLQEIKVKKFQPNLPACTRLGGGSGMPSSIHQASFVHLPLHAKLFRHLRHCVLYAPGFPGAYEIQSECYRTQRRLYWVLLLEEQLSNSTIPTTSSYHNCLQGKNSLTVAEEKGL